MYSPAYRIIVPSTESELKQYYQLRYEILRKPWGQKFDTVKDEWENVSLHVLMIDPSGNALSTGRLQYNSETEGQIRSMAVKEKFRNMGLGSEVLRFLEQHALEKKLSTIILDAREEAVNFYKNNGYTVEGDSYTLFGVIPHFRMIKIMAII